MKRKILSLALALMMIVSVAAALPVSAAPTQNINIDLTNLGKGNDGVIKATDVYTNNSYVATDLPEDADWIDPTQPVGFYKASETYGQMTINVPEAGYYDVSIAYGSPVSAVVGFRTNSAIVQENIEETTGANTDKATFEATIKTVKVHEFGRKIYLAEGSQTVYLHVKTTATASGDYAPAITFYAYNLLLEPSADQTTIEDIIMAADFNDKTYSGGGDLTSAPADNYGWIPTGLGYLATNTYDSAWSIYIPADGYYELSVATAKFGNNLKANILYEEQKIASSVALCTDSTGSSDVKVVTTERFMAMKGIHTIKLDYISGNDYLRGLKLSWSSNQAPEPVDVSFAECTAYSCHTSDTVFGGMAVPEGCTYDWVTSTSKRCYYGQTSLFRTSVTMPKTGYYDVLVATTSLNDSTGYVYGGGQFTYATIPATGDKTIVGVTNLGRIYLGKGTQDIHFQIKADSGNADQGGWAVRSTEIFDFRLQYSEDEYQTTPEEIIVSANAPSRFVMANKTSLGEKNRHTWPLDKGTNKCSWATNGATKIASAADWYEYDVFAPEAGYYDLYAASCTLNELSNSYMSVMVNDTLYVESAAQTDTNNTALNTATETHFGKVYLKEGINTVRVEGDADSSAYYFFNLKLSQTTLAEADKINLLGIDNNALEADTVAEGGEFFAEITTSKDARLFVVNYTKVNDEVIKMENFSEATNVITDGDVKVIRTDLFTAGSIVKVFLWEDGTFAPIDIVVPTIN